MISSKYLGVVVGVVVSFGLFSSVCADLVAHWKLDEGDGDLFEDSASGYDGFLPDGMTVEWDDGPPTQDNAVRFLGLDSFIATEFPGIGGNDPRTVTFWVKTVRLRHAARGAGTDDRAVRTGPGRVGIPGRSGL